MRNLLFCLLLIGYKNAKCSAILELRQLLSSGKLEMRVISTGAYQEDCLQLFVTNKSQSPIHLSLQPGMQFNSKNDSEQDLILTSATDKVLAPGAKLVCMAKAYCFQASRSCPSRGGLYSLFEKQDSSLTKVATFLAKRGFERHINQNAIWTVSDHHSISAIPDSSEALQSLRVLLSQLTHQSIPWYHTNYAHVRNASGRIDMVPLQLQTSISFSLPQLDYITVQLQDEQGRPAGFILQHWQQPGPAIDYPIAISTKNLARGKYSLVVCTKEQTLFRKEVEV